MLVCFDKRGVLKEQLDSYGNLPRVDSQTFKIFAYFKDIDLRNYGAAYIRLQRPDLSDSIYPLLFMVQADLVYDPSIVEPTVSNYFSSTGGPNNDGTYPCYLFDFSKIINSGDPLDSSDDSIVNLLDTPGQWQATITLLNTNSGAANVVGTISFNVEGPATQEEETEISFDIITHNMATIIATKLNANSTHYLRSMENFEAAALNGTLPKSIFPYPGLTVWDRTTKTFYKIESLTSVSDDYYSADWEKIVDLNDKLNISDSITVVSNILSVDLTKYAIAQLFYSRHDDSYYRKSINGTPEKIFGVGVLGAENTLVRYVVASDDILISDIPFLTNNSEKNVIVNYQNHDYILQISNLEEDHCDVVAFDPFNQCFYLGSNIDLSEYKIVDLILDSNKIDHVIRKYDTNTVYGVDSEGNQVNFRIDDLFDGYIKYFQVPDYQTSVSVIRDVLTNINGRPLSQHYDYIEKTIDSYPVYHIIWRETEENLTEEQARTYMRNMTGSEFLPKYDFNKPQNSFMMLPDGQILKPQWDNTNGLLLYKMKRFADVEYVNNNILTLSSASGTLTADEYAYALKKNARIFYSTTGICYEKYSEDVSYIKFVAINANVSNNQGVLTIANPQGCIITKATRAFNFAVGTSYQTYNKSKLDSDFATKAHVAEEIAKVRRNSLQNVDTEEYPTLQDFLASDGEEGYWYLYPVDTSDLDKGYYQYIWEYNADDDAYEWEYLGTTQIDLSDYEVSFEQETFADGAVTVEFAKNTDFQLISLVDTVSVQLVIPEEVSQGWISSCTFTVGNSRPTFALTNHSNYNVVFIVNNRKCDVSGISLNLDVNGIVECMAECNGFDIRIYMKEVTN